MKHITDLADLMLDEIKAAECYTEKYCWYKANDDNKASLYKKMAQDELEHASVLHDFVVEDIEKIKKIYMPPSNMLEEWKCMHASYVEKAALVKQMLSI